MSLNNVIGNCVPLAGTVATNPRMLEVRPAILRFLASYMGKFRIRRVGTNLILHSHLPPLNSRAYSRFVKEHLVSRTEGPSHAQIGITSACPQHCEYCYNRNRRGQMMSKETIKNVAAELKRMGVVWLGLTGGEPLLNRDIAEITESIADGCAVKLFTTGCTLTRQTALDLKNAGLFSVSVSLDHWTAEKHDRGRGYEGAFRQALKAIEIFQSVGGIHVGVSAVLSRQMILNHEVATFLEFLACLGIDEAWVSEVKPSIQAFWDEELVIREEDRLALVGMQDRYNASGHRMTVNYLGHFEGRECFGCNAGNKMVYVDAFGEVSPCVFTPISFGNVQNGSLREIVNEMRTSFPTEASCFINNNFRQLRRFSEGRSILTKRDAQLMLEQTPFGELSEFNKLYYRSARPRVTLCQRPQPVLGERA